MVLRHSVQYNASNPICPLIGQNQEAAVSMTSILPEGQGHVVNMRLVLVVEQIIVGELGDIQSQIQHMGLEVLVQVHSHSGSD